jgi:hypothetical protein
MTSGFSAYLSIFGDANRAAAAMSAINSVPILFVNITIPPSETFSLNAF